MAQGSPRFPSSSLATPVFPSLKAQYPVSGYQTLVILQDGSKMIFSCHFNTITLGGLL